MTKNYTTPGATLEEFSDQINGHLGVDVGFADRVRRRAVLKHTLKIAEDRRAELYRALKSAHINHQQTRAGRWILKPVTTRPTTRLWVGSDRLRDADAELWQRCRTSKYVRTNPPRGSVMPTADLWIPAAPTRAATTESLAHSYATMGRLMKSLEREAADLGAALEQIAQQCEWDGLPLLFRDYWWVQLKAEQYADANLKAVSPETFTKLAVEIPVKGSSKLEIREYDPERDFDPEAEHDEETYNGRDGYGRTRSAWGRTYNG